MNCKQIYLKRIIPFFLTFVAGLFIASFFVTIAAPSISSKRSVRNYRNYHHMRMENRRLKRTNCKMRKQLAERKDQLRMRESFETEFQNNFDVPPPPLPVRPHFGR